MSRYLLTIAIGPIQEFIASARRTRDFWYGSFVLSEISKAVAFALSSQGDLIFPAPGNAAKELAADSDLNVANVILTYTHEGKKPDDLAKEGQRIAREHWAGRAEEALGEFCKLAEEAKADVQSFLDLGRWSKQVNGFIEVNAAWVPFDAATDDYRLKRQRLMRLLAGRKNCRNFDQATETMIGIPKSSLDGSRETLFKAGVKAAKLPEKLQRRMRLSDGEQLDAIGLAKRLGADRHPCPSVSRLAADPWTRAAKEKCPKLLKKLVESAKYFTGGELVHLNQQQFGAFPYEGGILFKTRIKELIAEKRNDEIELLKSDLEDIYEVVGPPDQYLVVLAADGDRMGATISNLVCPEQHRIFSKALSSFATDARAMVEKHHGFLVYSGGDDVLALLPLDTAVECARQLHDGFDIILRDRCQGILRGIPTLSVGLAIGHFLDPFENLLDYARNAEKNAKGTLRDGLAIHYHPRSGAVIRIEGRWTKGLAARMEALTVLHRDEIIGDKIAFDLRELSRLYENWPTSARLPELIHADAQRLLNRKKGASDLTMVEGFSQILTDISNAGDLRHLAEEIVIARLFGEARKLSGWNPPKPAVKETAA